MFSTIRAGSNFQREGKATEVFATWAPSQQGFIIKGILVVVVNCELHVFVGVRFSGHFQVPCAVERLKRVVVLFIGGMK